jgi:hypothetical protein
MSDEAEPAAPAAANDAVPTSEIQPANEDSADVQTYQDALDGQDSQAALVPETAGGQRDGADHTEQDESASHQDTSQDTLLNVPDLNKDGPDGEESTRSSYASTSTSATTDGASLIASTADGISSRNTSVASSDSFKEMAAEANDDAQSNSETPAGSANIDNDSKRFSLPSPETPTMAQNPRSQISASPEPFQNGQDTRWRDSVAEGTATSRLDSVALTDSCVPVLPSSPRSYRDSLQGITNSARSAGDDEEVPEAGPSTPRFSTRMQQTQSDEALRPASSLSTSSATSQSSTYGLFRQRVQSQMSELDEDPTAKRKSVLGKQDLQANFERMKEEADHEGKDEDGRQAGNISQDADGNRQHAIDWDFWGDVMADYELMAKTRRAYCSPSS